MSNATLPRLLATRTVLLTAGIITLLAACRDEDPTGPVVPEMPDPEDAMPAAPASAAIAAANGKIAFRSDRIHFTNREIYVMNADGRHRPVSRTTRTPMPSPYGRPMAPSWPSPES